MAHHASAAVDAVVTYQPDVILLDANIPGLDGRALTRQLRAKSRLGQPLLISLADSKDAEYQFLTAECDRQLLKPINTEALEQLLASWKRAQEELRILPRGERKALEDVLTEVLCTQRFEEVKGTAQRHDRDIVPFEVLLSSHHATALEEKAWSLGLSPAELLRRLLCDFLNRPGSLEPHN